MFNTTGAGVRTMRGFTTPTVADGGDALGLGHYEPPAVVWLGSLETLTQGATGNCDDGLGGTYVDFSCSSGSTSLP